MHHFPERILIGVNRSDASRRAAELGAGLARSASAELHLCHVKLTTSPLVVQPGNEHQRGRMRQEGEQFLSDLAEELAGGDPTGVRTHLRSHRRVDRALTQLQDELDADMLVIGAGRVGHVGRRLLGSTVESVMHRTTRTVLVVRP